MTRLGLAAVGALLLTVATVSALGSSGDLTFSIVERALNAPESLVPKRLLLGTNDDPSRRRALLRAGATPSVGHPRDRNLEVADGDADTCDASFLKCISVDACASCFLEMETQDINWAGVAESTPCSDVVSFLNSDNHCMLLKGNQVSTDFFCNTFKSCVVWFDGDDDTYDGDDGDDSVSIDCGSLTECTWSGFHPSFIGNGVCNDGLDGCYNTAICGWDGGDCCKDTCKDDASYVECGHDGFYCRDPDSAACDSTLTNRCDPSKTKKDDGKVDPPRVECTSEESLFRIVMYDSFGDGWDNTKLTITPVGQTTKIIFAGGLESGSQGQDFVCLSKFPSCYHVAVKGGTWGNEISWEVKPLTAGAPTVAGGGAPMECNFGVAGGSCDDTCTGKPNILPSDDPGYKELKDLFQCVENKCVIQVGACHKDGVCDKCFHADPADYCYANDSFNAVADCTLCQCAEANNADFCAQKVSPGSVLPPVTPPADGGKTKREPCTPGETVQGGSAVIGFSKCIKYEEVSMMITDFDENNFGDLDKFEACAHSFATDDHGGHTALGCLQILVNAMNGASSVEKETNTPTEAIKALALSLYKDAASFCDCSKTASDKAPLCEGFLNFKTLLYESLDACQSLDEIDCDAWKEFYPPCQTSMTDKFGSVDFNKEEQCNYIRDNCGGVGPFPAFRRLDCDKEVSSEAWTFYQQYSKSCLKGEPLPPPPPPPPPNPAPGPGPTPIQPVPVPAPTKPYIPPPGPAPYVPPVTPGSKPYVPSDGGKSSKDYVPADKKKGMSWFWTIVLLGLFGGGAYYYYKRRSDGFNFIRYRRMRNNFRDDSDMYSGLALESSTSFEPPSLPPTPAALS